METDSRKETEGADVTGSTAGESIVSSNQQANLAVDELFHAEGEDIHNDQDAVGITNTDQTINDVDGVYKDDVERQAVQCDDAADSSAETHRDDAQRLQRLRAELSYACTYFSGARGFYNPFNVITAQAMSERLRFFAPTSVHQAEHLLRRPLADYGTASRNFAPTKLQNDLEIKSLCAQEILEILNYRTSQLDDIDIGLEAFKLLGGDENTPIAASKVTELLQICYASFDETLECVEDLQQHVAYVKEQIEATERLQAESNAQHYAGHKWHKERMPDPAGTEDILDVLEMSVGCDRRSLTLSQFRELFDGMRKLEFRDYRKDIERASGKLVFNKK